MSSDEYSIRVNGLGKRYEIYETPRDRLKQFVIPKLRRLVGLQPKQYYREFWALRDVTLSFDVPQTDPASEPFIAWQASAQALSLGMDAAIVDDNGAPLSAAGFEHIGGQLGQLYEALAARDLAAGSPAARRLFS